MTDKQVSDIHAEAEDFKELLARLPRSYGGPSGTFAAPYGLVGAGEGGALAAHLARLLVPERRASEGGTQFVLSSPDAAALASEYAAAAQAADDLLAALAQACAGDDVKGNPALELAWKLRHRTPLLLAGEGAEALAVAWQQVLARVGKSYSQPVLGEPLATVTGMFEARHEAGDGKVAVILGELSPRLDICREVLETRVDEVVHLPYPAVSEGLEGGMYAGTLALWYLGVWTAYHLAALEEQSPADAPALTEALQVLAGA